MYDTPRAALQALTDDTLFERVAVKVLRTRFPELRITGPSGDLNRDAFGRPLFGEHDQIVLLVSCEARWTGKAGKLKRDLGGYCTYPAQDRPEKAFFVTNRSVRQTSLPAYKKWAWDTLRIKLEVVDLNELALDLESDALHRVAEYDLGVRPRKPRVLQPVAVFRDAQRPLSSGADAPLVGRDREMQFLHDVLIQARQPGAARIIVIEGPAGAGKTRLAVDAAHAAATTLVAAPGTAVSADSLVDVPLDAPSVVVADDAHRSPDLSGIAAMLGDPRFAGVKAILTVPAGSSAGVLTRWGLNRGKTQTVSLAGLDRTEIDQIVISRGFSGVAFRSHVIEVAQGSPWLAHSACQVATEQQIYRWSDTAELLKQQAEQQLRQAGFDSDEHRAAAAALAVLTTADDGRQLAVLAGAVTALPQDPGRLDTLLEDLVQAGIAAGPPYLIRPAAFAPVLTAAALDPRARAKIKLSPALKSLGRAALLTQAADPPPGDSSVLGVTSRRARVYPSVEIDAARLAAQLSVLAQAASQRDDHRTLEMLQEAVRELVPDQADTAAWLEVLTVAEPVAAASPRLAGDLRDTLISQWPPAATPSPWDGNPVRRYRYDVEALLNQALAIGKQAGRADVNRAVSWMLECAWLSQPILGTASIDFAGRAVRSLLGTRFRSAAQTWDDIFTARQQVLDAVLRWGRDRCAGPPTGLPDTELEVRDPAIAIHVLLAALTPLLTVIAEEHSFGMPEAARVFVWSHHVLPDDPRTTAIMMTAADAAGALLGKLEPLSPEARPVLQAIVRLPQRIRAESARGPGSETPMPVYAAEIMNKAAFRISEAIAASWPDLPLTVRYAAAQTTARHSGRRGGPLADLAADGDLVAMAAAADGELGRLLTILPIDHPRDRQASASSISDEAETRRRRARDLAEQLPVSEAIELLTVADPATASTCQYDCLATFAHTVGRTAADPYPILQSLSEGPVSAGIDLFSGLLQAWPAKSRAWLSENISNTHVARLALWAADELPPDQEAVLLSEIMARLAADGDAAHTTGTDAAHASHDAPGTGSSDIGTPDLPALAMQVADHLGRCRARPAERLTRLAALGSCTAAGDTLQRIFTAVDTILASLPDMHALAGDDNRDLRQDLAGLLTKVLAPADDGFAADIDHDIAAAAEALGRAAPDETAQILADRTLTAALPVIPFRWEDLLAQAPPAQREPLAAAYYERIQPHLSARALPARVEATALDTLALLGRGTPQWTKLIRSWSAGNATDRARAATAIRRCWHDPIWQELVPELLDAGLSEESVTMLREDLLPINDVCDAAGLSSRLEVLNPLLGDPRPVVQQFAGEAAQAVRAWMSPLQGWETGS